MGFACYAVLKACCGLDAARLSAMAARFSKPVFPGETLRFDLWRHGGQVRFRAVVADRDALVLDRGLAALNAEA